MIGGLFGTAVLIAFAPVLAEVALKFSSFEYFWLVVLGLSGAVFIGTSSKLKAVTSLMLGLLVASVGLDNPGAHPRFTFGNAELTGGVSLIPVMVGMFAVSEILRYVTSIHPPPVIAAEKIGNVFRGMWGLTKKYKVQVLRGSAIGTAIGIQPGAGADIAAWITYAASKRFSKEPEKFGTGHVEGIVESGAANNSALAGAWVPALVFGIPGDSITAIAIGVLYLKNMNPGPTLFINNPQNVYAIFLVFILANLIMLPLGYLAIKVAKTVLRAPQKLLMPVILLFCAVGAFAINNTVFGVLLILVFGLFAFVLEENGFPTAPAILGVVLGGMLEENFVTSMIKADGDASAFFTRPIAGGLAAAHLRDPGVAGVRGLVAPRTRTAGGLTPPCQRRRRRRPTTATTWRVGDWRHLGGLRLLGHGRLGRRGGAHRRLGRGHRLVLRAAWASLASSAGQASAPALKNASAVHNSFMATPGWV